jgi:hypothetical protein
VGHARGLGDRWARGRPGTGQAEDHTEHCRDR